MCSCGNHDAHPIARRVTADGVHIDIWSDGMVTDASVIAGYLPGVGRKRLPAAPLWAFAGEVWLYTVPELPGLVTEHQRAAKAQATSDHRDRHPSRHHEDDRIVARGATLSRAFGHRAAIEGPIFGPSGQGSKIVA